MALSNLKSLKVFDTPGDTHVARAMAWKKKEGWYQCGLRVVEVTLQPRWLACR